MLAIRSATTRSISIGAAVSYRRLQRGNGDGEEQTAPQCLEAPANADCSQRSYPPEDGVTYRFTNMFQRSINGVCNDGPCHDAVDPAGGLDMTTERRAYDNLLDDTLGRPRVIPGDVQCGKLIVYLETPGEGTQCPPALIQQNRSCACFGNGSLEEPINKMRVTLATSQGAAGRVDAHRRNSSERF